jgi:DNA-binding CsgD family transcriptional regulator
LVSITRREREIALLAARGLASKQIGARLFISARTVDNHLAKVYVKLGVRTRTELAEVLGRSALAV